MPPVKSRGAKARPGAAQAPGRVRIIAGRWRGRRVEFAPVPGLRPTPDRVRETVFNWLAPQLQGARVLDLYAGSGAFGLEALSRGAREAVLVDADGQVVQQLRRQGAVLGADGLHVVHSDVRAFLSGSGVSFDLAFVDPPYGKNLLAACCQALQAGAWLKPGALVYLEAEAALGEPPLPAKWTLVRSKRAGQVGYHLAHVASAEPDLR